MARRKVNPGDTVYLLVEHLYYVDGRAAPLFEYRIVKGTVVELILGGYTQAKVRTVEDGIVCLHYPNCAGFGKTFFADYESAVKYGEFVAEKYDDMWSGINGETIRRPWREGTDGQSLNGT